MPPVPAIYIIRGKNRTLYVGETANFKNRCAAHWCHGRRYAALCDSDWEPEPEVLVELPEGTPQARRLAVEEQWRRHFAQFYRMANGKKNVRKRPTVRGEKHRKSKPFRVQNVVTGEVVEGTGLAHWARTNGVPPQNLYKTKSGERTHAGGWRLL